MKKDLENTASPEEIAHVVRLVKEHYQKTPIADPQFLQSFDWLKKGIVHLDLPETCAKFPEIKLAVPENTPPYSRVGWFPSTNGEGNKIFVLFVGTGEAIEKHQPAIDALNARGRDVVVYEPPGQAGSGRWLNNPFKIYTPRHGFDFWMHGIQEFLESPIYAQIQNIAQQRKDSAIVALPYSLGGLLFARVMQKWPQLAEKFTHIVYVNPAVAFRSAGKTMLKRYYNAARVTAGVALGWRENYLPGHSEIAPYKRSVDKSRIGSDPFRHEWINNFYFWNPEKVMRGTTFGWFYEANRALTKLWWDMSVNMITGRAASKTPTAVILSGRDELSDQKMVKLLARRIGADIIMLPTAKHEPTQEPEHIRSGTFNSISAWINGIRKKHEDSVVKFIPNRRQTQLRKQLAHKQAQV